MYTDIESIGLYPLRANSLVLEEMGPRGANVRRRTKTVAVELFVQNIQARLPALIADRFLAK